MCVWGGGGVSCINSSLVLIQRKPNNLIFYKCRYGYLNFNPKQRYGPSCTQTAHQESLILSVVSQNSGSYSSEYVGYGPSFLRSMH